MIAWLWYDQGPISLLQWSSHCSTVPAGHLPKDFLGPPAGHYSDAGPAALGRQQMAHLGSKKVAPSLEGGHWTLVVPNALAAVIWKREKQAGFVGTPDRKYGDIFTAETAEAAEVNGEI